MKTNCLLFRKKGRKHDQRGRYFLKKYIGELNQKLACWQNDRFAE